MFTRLTTTLVVSLASLSLASSAFAVSEANAAADTNGDGVLTIDEVQALYPDVSMDGFSAMDLDSDGALDAAEITAAEEAGLMPKG